MSKKIAITLGEPAGIGVELVVKLALAGHLNNCIVLGDEKLIQKHIDANKLNLTINYSAPGCHMLTCKNIPTHDIVELGKLNKKNASYVLSLLDTALEGCQDGTYSAMVTCPLHKGIINDSGIQFTGHTEYLATKSNCKKVVMMLLNKHMKVALATTHIPLKQVSEEINKTDLTETIEVIINDMKNKFGVKEPKIAVCGLNPHAGEDGYLGMEEIEIINPVIAELKNKGNKIYGSIPADSLFTSDKLKNYDAVLAMYHDQGLTPLKYAGFGQSVNISLGLPFIRCSVDHGTALDIAGKNMANTSSLYEAIKLAKELTLEAR